jgi:hypothetical protein
VEGPKRAHSRLKGRGPERSDLPGFRAAEKSTTTPLGVESRAFRRLIETIPTTPEGGAAFVAYLHARCWEDPFGGDYDQERTKLQTISEAVASMMMAPHPPSSNASIACPETQRRDREGRCQTPSQMGAAERGHAPGGEGTAQCRGGESTSTPHPRRAARFGPFFWRSTTVHSLSRSAALR